MQLTLKGKYQSWTLEVTSDLIKQMWESPQTVGGGASTYRTNGGAVWMTKEGWAFSRTGSPGWGWIELHDPQPGRGCVRKTWGPFQTADQRATYIHPAVQTACVISE